MNACPECGAELDPIAPVPEACPACGHPLATKPAAAKCPMCAEPIPAGAKKCPHCGSVLDPRMRRAEKARNRVVVVGDLFRCLVRSLPGGTCYLCGTGEGVTPVPRKFSFSPPWAILLVVACGLLPGLLILLFAQRRATIAIPLCGECVKATRNATALELLFGVFGIFGFPILGGFLGSAIAPPDGGVWGAVVGFSAWLLGLILLEVLFIQKKRIHCKGIEPGGHVDLKFPNFEIASRALNNGGGPA